MKFLIVWHEAKIQIPVQSYLPTWKKRYFITITLKVHNVKLFSVLHADTVFNVIYLRDIKDVAVMSFVLMRSVHPKLSSVSHLCPWCTVKQKFCSSGIFVLSFDSPKNFSRSFCHIKFRIFSNTFIHLKSFLLLLSQIFHEMCGSF